MNRKNFYASLYSAALLLMAVPVSLCITSCSDAMTDNVLADDDEVHIYATFEGVPEGTTRAFSAPVAGINSIYLHAYQGTTRKGYNVKYTYDGTTWKTSGAKITWPSTAAISIFGLTESYREILADNMKERKIDYYVPPIGAKDVWFGSALNQTKAKTGGNVNLKFARMVSRVNLSCKNSMANGAVKISKIIIHNIVSAGTFTYSDKSASAGTWTLLNTGENPYYANYPQKLKVNEANRDDALPVVPPVTSSKLVTDSAYILIPQKTVKWVPNKDANQDTTYAATNHQCYLEVRCQVYETDELGNLGACVWGNPDATTEDEMYEPIFVPFYKSWSKSNSASNIVFDIADGYNADGSPWEPHPGTTIRFDESMLLTPIMDDGNVDAWDKDDPDTVFDVTL